MKKTSLLVALPALALSGLLLSGCGMFRSHKAWDTAQQESPLEIPPQLDRPVATAALTIPPAGANEPTAAGIRAGAVGTQIIDSFVMADSVDSAYQRIGQLLKSGDVGQLVSHDDATRSYTFNVSDAIVQQKKRGFFGRLFRHGSNYSTNVPAGASHQVQVSIGSSGTDASEVQLQGSPGVVPRAIDALRSRLKKAKKSAS